MSQLEIERMRLATPDMLAALDACREYLWGHLCRDNLGGGEATHPTSVLFRRVEAAIEKARFG